MKGVVITEKNYRQVVGRLNKFFTHPEFECWHCIDGGMKKRIKPTVFALGSNLSTKTNFFQHRFDVITEDLQRYAVVARLKIGRCGTFPFCFGTEVYFLGSRIITTQSVGLDHTAYTCFQIRA